MVSAQPHWKEFPVLSSMSTAALMPTQPPDQWLKWALQSGQQRGRSVSLTINLHVIIEGNNEQSYESNQRHVFSLCCICCLDLRKMSVVTPHLSATEFLGTGAEFGHISSGFLILTTTAALLYNQVSIFTEVCQRPNQAVHSLNC